MKIILDLLRINQWIKNLFILAPLFFAGHLTEQRGFFVALLTTIAFCCVSSSVYIFNDFLDRPTDQLHPVKKNRPLSSKNINHEMALKIAVLLLAVGIAMGSLVNIKVLMVILVYLGLHVIYNGWARKVVFWDILFIAFGFQLRIWAGAFAAQVAPSGWLLLCVFVLSLFLGLVKRRCEIEMLQEKAVEHRLVLSGYKAFPLDSVIMLFSMFTIITYGLYTISHDVVARLGNYWMFYSMAFVVFGIFRYLYLVYVKKAGDDPAEVLLKDLFSVINIILWLIYICRIIY